MRSTWPAASATWRTGCGGLSMLVHPARWEGFGLALLEAMLARLPIIASAVSAIPEIVVDGTTGILIPPDDVRRLRAAICRLLDDPALGPRVRRRRVRAGTRPRSRSRPWPSARSTSTARRSSSRSRAGRRHRPTSRRSDARAHARVASPRSRPSRREGARPTAVILSASPSTSSSGKRNGGSRSSSSSSKSGFETITGRHAAAAS